MDLSDLKDLTGTPEEITVALKEHLPAVHTLINQGGYKAGFARGTAEYETEEKTGKLDLAAKDAETLKEQIKGLDAKIVTLSEEKPDFAKEQAKYELALQAKQEALDEVLGRENTLTADHKEQLRVKDAAYFEASLARSLTALHMKPLFVRGIAADPKTKARYEQTGDGTWRVFTDDGVTPAQIDGQEPWDYLAGDLAKGLEKGAFTDMRNHGADFKNNEADGRSKTIRRSDFDKLSAADQHAVGVKASEGEIKIVD